MASEPGWSVVVVYAPAPRQVTEVLLTLTQPCTVLGALQCSGLLSTFPEIDHADILVGVWGRRVPLGHVLRNHDRVEIYRPLRVDPKVARRERFVKQGSRSAGLFDKKRAGGKAGY